MTSKDRITNIRKLLYGVSQTAGAIAGDTTLPEEVRTLTKIIADKTTLAEELVREIANEEGIPLTEGNANA